MKELTLYLKFLLAPPKERMRMVFAGSALHALLTFPDGERMRFGDGKPDLTLVFHSWKPLKGFFSEYRFAKGYIDGEIDIEGDLHLLSALRDPLLNVPSPLYGLNLLANFFLRRLRKLNKAAISRHYDIGNGFQLDFISRKYPVYSQCVYPTGRETLEQAAVVKLENMVNALELKPGMRLLDLGGGWGCVPEYCCPRGIDVTVLTLGDESYNYIKSLFEKKGYENARVIKKDFFDYHPEQPFDALVNFGVMEHLPRYRRVMPLLWNVLKPQAKIFFDFSSAIFKYSTSRFTHDYVWSGGHCFVCLQDFVAELLYHGFELLRVQNERRDYALTAREWHRRFVANRAGNVSLVGERNYRIFNLFLSMNSISFEDYRLQAYHVLAQRRDERGARPGFWRRLKNFILSLN